MLFEEDATVLDDSCCVECNTLSLTLEQLSLLFICWTLKMTFDLWDHLFHDDFMTSYVFKDLSKHLIALEHDFTSDQ